MCEFLFGHLLPARHVLGCPVLMPQWHDFLQQLFVLGVVILFLSKLQLAADLIQLLLVVVGVIQVVGLEVSALQRQCLGPTPEPLVHGHSQVGCPGQFLSLLIASHDCLRLYYNVWLVLSI